MIINNAGDYKHKIQIVKETITKDKDGFAIPKDKYAWS